MVVLSAFNKGGVGKTTLAVHAAGVMRGRAIRILVIDCVDQADSFRFFAGHDPVRHMQLLEAREGISVVYNPRRRELRNFVGLEEFDHIILDVNSPAADTVQVIIGSDPDKVLLPINDQALAFSNLQTTLAVLSEMERKMGYALFCAVVPLGVTLASVAQQISQLEEKPSRLLVSRPIRKHRSAFEIALTTGQYVWDVDDSCSYVETILNEIMVA